MFDAYTPIAVSLLYDFVETFGLVGLAITCIALQAIAYKLIDVITSSWR